MKVGHLEAVADLDYLSGNQIGERGNAGIAAHELAKVMGLATLQMLMRYYNPTAKELAAKLA